MQIQASVPARYECGVCWTVYDPVDGDEMAQVPRGTPFDDLSEHWVCPNCSATRDKFRRLEES